MTYILYILTLNEVVSIMLVSQRKGNIHNAYVKRVLGPVVSSCFGYHIAHLMPCMFNINGMIEWKMKSKKGPACHLCSQDIIVCLPVNMQAYINWTKIYSIYNSFLSWIRIIELIKIWFSLGSSSPIYSVTGWTIPITWEMNPRIKPGF